MVWRTVQREKSKRSCWLKDEISVAGSQAPKVMLYSQVPTFPHFSTRPPEWRVGRKWFPKSLLSKKKKNTSGGLRKRTWVEMTLKLFCKTFRAECYMPIKQGSWELVCRCLVITSSYWLKHTPPNTPSASKEQSHQDVCGSEEGALVGRAREESGRRGQTDKGRERNGKYFKKPLALRKWSKFLTGPIQASFISKPCTGLLVLQPVVSWERSPYSGQDWTKSRVCRG